MPTFGVIQVLVYAIVVSESFEYVEPGRDRRDGGLMRLTPTFAGDVGLVPVSKNFVSLEMASGRTRTHTSIFVLRTFSSPTGDSVVLFDEDMLFFVGPPDD